MKAEEQARAVAEKLAREYGIAAVGYEDLRRLMASVGIWRSDRAKDFLLFLEGQGWIKSTAPGRWRLKRLETDDEELIRKIREEVDQANQAVDLKAQESRAMAALWVEARKTRKRRVKRGRR